MLRMVAIVVSIIMLLAPGQMAFAENSSFAARPEVQAFIDMMVKKHQFKNLYPGLSGG